MTRLAGSRITATCTHSFSTTGFAAVSARAVPPATIAARKPVRLASANSLFDAFCPKSKTCPEAPVGRNSHAVTLIVSSPASASAGS
jgi:hypothetical protein